MRHITVSMIGINCFSEAAYYNSNLVILILSVQMEATHGEASSSSSISFLTPETYIF